MNPNVKALKIPLLVILCLSSILLFHNPISHSVSADVYTSDKISSGGSNYTLYLDLSTTSWTRGTLIYFDVGLTVNSFGPGVVDFHGIELWLKFDNGSGYEVTDSSTGGIIDTVGNSFEDSWYLTPSIAMADSFTIYIGSKFLEDTGVSDPYTDDGWTSMANVTVSNPAPPALSHPVDMIANEGEVSARIIWTAISDNPDYYHIYRNGSYVEIGVWTSQTPIYHSLGYYPTGDYEFSIYVYDDYGQCVNDTVLVQIRDLAAPVVNSPVDIIIEESATGQYVEWTAVDVHPKSYELLRDGIAIDSGTWDAYTLLRFSLDSLILGRYNYCLILTDVSNNIATDCVNVEVVETTRSGSVSIIVNLLIIITLASISSILKRRFN